MKSNFAELRQIRTEMSAEAGHDVRRFIALLEGVREKYRAHLVNHGAEAERSLATEPPAELVSNVTVNTSPTR